MAVSTLYRRQHSDLVELVKQMSVMLDEDALSGGGAAETKDLLTHFAGKLLIHLAAEDDALYPKLIAAADREISDTAKRFKDEMGGLKEDFLAYQAIWGRTEYIQKDPAGFVRETQRLFKALGNRVEREDTVLFPLADRL